jgi:hypothetical protein
MSTTLSRSIGLTQATAMVVGTIVGWSIIPRALMLDGQDRLDGRDRLDGQDRLEGQEGR